MALRGRHWVAGWLLAFLAAAGLVVARSTSGLRQARALGEARIARAALEARRAELEQRARVAQSRRVLVPLAQQRGLRLPSDSEIVLLPVPAEPR
jgi:protein involved in polysaccharide export with SLBB domain